MRTREGFTIIELLFGLSILAVVLTMAWPTTKQSSDRLRLQEAARVLEADIARARVESVRRNERVWVARSGTGTYAVQYIGRRDLGAGIRFTAGPDTVRFVPFGPVVTGATQYVLALGSLTTTVRVGPSGMVVVQ